MESVYNKFRSELEQVENSFVKPQIDRSNEESEANMSALSVFNEGFARFIEFNQFKIDDIEKQTINFREGKREFIANLRAQIAEFRSLVQQSSTIVSLKSLFTKHYNLTPVRGLTDQT